MPQSHELLLRNPTLRDDDIHNAVTASICPDTCDWDLGSK